MDGSFLFRFDSLSIECCPERLIQAKLTAIRQAVNSQVFQDSPSRNLLLPTCSLHVKTHLLDRYELLEKLLIVNAMHFELQSKNLSIIENLI